MWLRFTLPQMATGQRRRCMIAALQIVEKWMHQMTHIRLRGIAIDRLNSVRFKWKENDKIFIFNLNEINSQCPCMRHAHAIKFRRVSACPIPYAHSITQSCSALAWCIVFARNISCVHLPSYRLCPVAADPTESRQKKNETRIMKIKCLDTVRTKWHRLINCLQFGLILDLMVVSLRLSVLNFRKTLKIRTNDSRMNSN